MILTYKQKIKEGGLYRVPLLLYNSTHTVIMST